MSWINHKRYVWGLGCPAGRKRASESAAYPQMHEQESLELDLWGKSHIDDATLMRWFNSRYSTSKHLLTLYSMIIGLKAKTIVEVGFGRSSFVLTRAAIENQAELFSVDQRDFSYLLSSEEKKHMQFIAGNSDILWEKLRNSQRKMDFAFLDYFSNPHARDTFCRQELKVCFELLAPGGVICIHDAYTAKYAHTPILEDFCKDHGFVCAVLPFNYGLAVIHKSGIGVTQPLLDPWIKI